jgi:hypothetical protein
MDLCFGASQNTSNEGLELFMDVDDPAELVRILHV